MEMYQYNLNTFAVPPLGSCNISELERICYERLQLYKIIEEAHHLGYKPTSNIWLQHVESQIIHHRLSDYISLLKNEEYSVGLNNARRNNHIAHWLLSLCYCHSKSLRIFFTSCEIHWFVMLYKKMKKEDIREFYKHCEIKYEHVSEQEKNFFEEKLLACRSLEENAFNDIMYYKIEFNEVCNLVGIRKIFLYKGFAYFPECDMIQCIKYKLLKQFNRQLIWNDRMLPTNITDDRFEAFLKNLPVVTPNHGKLSDKEIVVNLENIDEVAQNHFPLCMKTIHSILREQHHLKYDCKMQYGIFLKCLGLSYEHAMEFWKDEFTKKMPSDFYDRKYSYLFKHHYGKVGGRIQYQPYTCNEILDKCPGPNQHHGCPFKHWGLERLLQRCQNDGFSVENMTELKDLVTNNKFKEACVLYFSVTHKVYTGETSLMNEVQTPNQYAEASYEYEDSLNSYLSSIFNEF